MPTQHRRDVSLDARGIAELARAFRAMDADLPKRLRVEYRKVADHVVGVAQQRMPFVSGTAAKSLRPVAGQKYAGISFPAGGPGSGGDKDGYYPWLDFGGTVGRGRVSAGGHMAASSSGNVIRPVVKGGRYLYPAIAESRDEIEQGTGDAIEAAAHGQSFDTEGF